MLSDTVAPIQIATTDFQHTLKDAFIIGWGVYNLDPRTASPVLRYAKIDLLSNEECDDFLIDTGISSDKMICTDPRDSISVCGGDSGGPLVQYDESGILWQIGVTSWVSSNICGTTEAASGYVGVRYFRDWIDFVLLNAN